MYAWLINIACLAIESACTGTAYARKSISLSVYSASESISLEIMQAAHAVYWKMKTCLYEIYLLHVVPAFSYHMGSIPVVCTLHWHLCCPRSHHRWCPKCRWYTPPPFRTCSHQTEVSKTYPDKELWERVHIGSHLLSRSYSCINCSTCVPCSCVYVSMLRCILVLPVRVLVC